MAKQHFCCILFRHADTPNFHTVPKTGYRALWELREITTMDEWETSSWQRRDAVSFSLVSLSEQEVSEGWCSWRQETWRRVKGFQLSNLMDTHFAATPKYQKRKLKRESDRYEHIPPPRPKHARTRIPLRLTHLSYYDGESEDPPHKERTRGFKPTTFVQLC